MSFKDNYSKTASFANRYKLPSARELPSLIHAFLTPVRLAAILIFTLVFWFLASSIPASQESLQKYYCFGPAMSPFEIDINTYSDWHRNSPSPVKFNNHVAIDATNATSISFIDLNPIKSTPDAAEHKERVLILTPLRDAAPYIPKYVDLLAALDYPHDLIDLGLLVSDTVDETLAMVTTELKRLQDSHKPFRSVTIVQKDFGFNQLDNMNVEERHSFKAQAPRRKTMARARNYLLSATLKQDHSWVMWRDVDMIEAPRGIISDLIHHNKDIIVPNVWFHRYEDGKDIEGRFDYNSWVDTDKTRKLLKTLDKDTILVEGYPEFDTGRDYMARKGDWRQDPHEELALDGVGGVSIMVKADVHRSGINFPAYPFENQCETEGFAKMAKRAGYSVYGLPNYVVWHIDTAEKSHDKDEVSKLPDTDIAMPEEQPEQKPEEKNEPKQQKQEEPKEDNTKTNTESKNEKKPEEKKETKEGDESIKPSDAVSKEAENDHKENHEHK